MSWLNNELAVSFAYVTQFVLLAVLPDEQSSTDVNIEGANHAQLRNLYTVLQQMEQLHWNTLSLIAAVCVCVCVCAHETLSLH